MQINLAGAKKVSGYNHAKAYNKRSNHNACKNKYSEGPLHIYLSIYKLASSGSDPDHYVHSLLNCQNK